MTFDGISDGFEVLGKHSSPGESIKLLPLPAWGADPRHKDLFMEIDFARASEIENTSHVVHQMSISAARSFTEIFADSYESSPFFQLYNAKVLRNPDNKPGINAHLDIGKRPIIASDLGKYGDWGGFSSVNALLINGNWERAKPNDAWKNNMDAFRRGIFKYSLGVAGGRGQCPIGGFACIFNFHNNTIPAHETGHSLGIGHSGISSYYGDIDPNCNPAYFSIMNYAYQNSYYVGFSSRPKNTFLNNQAVEEWEAVDPDLPFFSYLSSIFKYHVDPVNGHVDWNRDGSFAPEGIKVKAYINNAPSKGCEFPRYNQMDIRDAQTDKAPVLAKLGNKSFVFYKPANNQILGINFQSSTSDWNCPVPAKKGCGGDTWSSKNSLNLGTEDGFDVTNIGPRNNQRLLLVSNWVNGFLWYMELSLDSGGNLESGLVNLLPNSSKAIGPPALAVLNSEKIMLSFKDEDNLIRYRYYQKSGSTWNWSEEQIALSDFGNEIEASSDTFPSLIHTTLEWNNNEPTTYGAFITSGGNRLNLWAFNPSTERWRNTGLINTDIRSPVGKAELAWIPAKSYFDGLGRLYLLYLSKEGERTVPRMLISYHKVDVSAGIRNQVVGLASWFDNYDYSSLGFDIFHDPDSEHEHLRYVGVFPDNATQIQFRPKANAIHDFVYSNLNDWETMGKFLCRTVVNPDGTVSNPINCH